MVLHRQGSIDTRPLQAEQVPDPVLGARDVAIQVEACGICRTDLHVVEGDLPPEKIPIIPGHQVVGRVVDRGPEASQFDVGDRVGIAWLRGTDGTCRYCTHGRENLCPGAQFTGYTADGGYAELATVREDFAHRVPQGLKAIRVAPLLCAGIIGYRALNRTEIMR